MVRGRVKKLFITSIMITFSLFIYSTPVSANTSIPVSANTSANSVMFRYQQGSGGYSNSTARLCNNNDTPALVDYTGILVDSPYWSYSKEDYVAIIFSIYNWSNNNSVDTTFTPNFSSSWGYQWVDLSSEPIGNAGYLYKGIAKITENYTGNLSFYFTNNGNPVLTMKSYECIAMSGMTYYNVVRPSGSSGSDTQIIQQIKNETTNIYSKLNESLTTQNLIYSEIREIRNAEQGVAQQQQQDRQEQEQQGQQSQTDSNTAGQQVEGATTSLINIIGGFFGAFINASATNCVFNMGIILEEVDMCSAYIPATYNVILSIVSLLFIVPMVIWLINSILSAFKEFQE